MSGNMRAWIVSEPDLWMAVWFAATRGRARVEAADFFGVPDPFAAGFSVRRAPDLDQYLDYWLVHTDVPAQAWWARGDLARCAGCGWALDQHGGHGGDGERPLPPVVIGGKAYHAACAQGMVG